MEESRYEVNLLLTAFNACLKRHILIWEGAGLLVGFVCFNFFYKLGMLPTAKAFVFPLLFLLGLFLLYVCVAIGNAGATVLLSKGESSLRDWTDVLPFDKKFMGAIWMSVVFVAIGGIMLLTAVIISLPGKAWGAVWLAFCSLPVLILCMGSIVAMFQGLFMFPSYLSSEQDTTDSFRRFVKFLRVNWLRILGFEGLFLGMAILLSLPQTAVAHLSVGFLDSIADSLGLEDKLYAGFPSLVIHTIGLAPLEALCALLPTSFLTTACFHFSMSIKGKR